MESGFDEPFDNLDSPPEVQMFLVDADFMDRDVFGEFLALKAGLRSRGKHVHAQVATAGILLQKTKIRFRGPAAYRRKFIIERQDFHFQFYRQ